MIYLAVIPSKESSMAVLPSFFSVFAIGLLLLSFFLIQTIERMAEEVRKCWGAKSWEKVQAVEVGVQWKDYASKLILNCGMLA